MAHTTLRTRVVGCPNAPGTWSRTWAERSRTGRGGDRVRGQAGSAGKETRPPSESGRGRGEVSPQLPDSEPAGAGSGSACGRRRAPGPSTAGRGRLPPPAGPRRVLTCPPVAFTWVTAGAAPLVGRGRRAETRPAEPSPSFHLLVPGARQQQRPHSQPNSSLQEEGIPGLLHPKSSLSTSSRVRARPHSWLRPSERGRGGGCSYLLPPQARSPELAPRPLRFQRPQPSGVSGRRRVLRTSPAEVILGGESESLIPTQHGGGVWGGFPRQLRLRGCEEVALQHAESGSTMLLPTRGPCARQLGCLLRWSWDGRSHPLSLSPFPWSRSV